MMYNMYINILLKKLWMKEAKHVCALFLFLSNENKTCKSQEISQQKVTRINCFPRPKWPLPQSPRLMPIAEGRVVKPHAILLHSFPNPPLAIEEGEEDHLMTIDQC